MAEMKTDWPYPVMETTLDKRLEKPGVQQGMASELTGVDGRSEGGLKPFPGFRKVHTMTGLRSQANHSHLSEVIDFHAVDFRIGAEEYGYGFVYRAKRPAAPTVCDVFIDYWDSVTGNWTLCTKLMSAVDAAAQFDVSVAGRFVYCFASGRSPSLFYIEATRTKTYEAEADSYISSNATTTNYGSQETLEIQNGGGTKKVLLRFDTTDGANKTVESATLSYTVSGNSMLAVEDVTVACVNDPSTTAVLWNELQVTWNARATATNWSTAGGTAAVSPVATTSIGIGFFGRVSMNVKALVQDAIDSVHQVFTDKADFLLSVSAGTGTISVASREQDNPAIRPKLTVTYEDLVFLNPVVIGEDGTTDPLPGPGKQPTLKSPERGIAPGSFTSLDEGRPASAQVILVSDDPYSTDLEFPDEVSGLCPTDTAPAAPAATVPGTTFTPSPTAGACTPSATGFLIQLLSPANRQTGVSVTPKLNWNAYYTDGEQVSPNVRYAVFLVEDGQDALDNHAVATGLTDTYYEPASLWPSGKMPYAKKFLWKVEAYRLDCDDFDVFSTTGSFTTESRYLARKFEPGDYSFGYVLVDSKTGRRSSFSEVAQVRSEDFVVARVQNGQTISTKRDQYMGVEIVYDSSKYDLMYVYRSVKIQDAGGTMMAGLPFLDAVVELEDYHTCLNGTGRTFDPASTDNRHAIYFYELEDKQLVYQEPYSDRSVFDDRMPYGGAAHFYQNTMLVSRIDAPPPSTEDEDRPADPSRGLGELRWSSLMEISPELFPPFNRYNPSVSSNEVIAFSRIGGNVLGLSRDKAYHIRKSGPFIKITEMHEGYGIVNPKAVDSVGSAAYFVTSHGLKAVDMQGQLDEIRNLNSVMVREWRTDLGSVQVSHDPFMNCLFLLNPVQEEAYVLWFSTGRTTKLADSGFDHVSQGAWPGNWQSAADEYNPLTRRAFFLQNNQETRASGTGFASYPGPAVYVVDAYMDRTISGGTIAWNGSRRITTLDFAGDSRFVASGGWDVVSKFIPISAGTGTVVAAGAWQFAYIYLVHSTSNKTLVGSRAKVMWNTTTSVFIDETQYPWVTSIKGNDVFVVSPVVFEWAGHPLGLQTEQGMVFSNADFFRMKVISSVGAAFSDVSGPPLTDAVTVPQKPLNSFWGLVYKGTGDTEYTKARTINVDGGVYASVQDGEGVVYAGFGSDDSDGRYGAKGTSLNPGLRILCPDLDFRLLGCIVRGTITTVERTTNHRGS